MIERVQLRRSWGKGLLLVGLIGSAVVAIAMFRVSVSAAAPFVASQEELSAFAQEKARELIRDRYACLGCHELDGEGGRIGPDLSTVGSRLNEASIYQMTLRPESQVPGTVMPAQRMTEDRRRLIARFLAQRGTGGGARPLVQRPVTEPADGAALYTKFCAACHGAQGSGDGPNAEYLPVSPTAHADSALMSTRPDDTLYDGIHAGGRILGRSHRMPAFGERLTHVQILSLVQHIRALCECSGPSWSQGESSR